MVAWIAAGNLLRGRPVESASENSSCTEYIRADEGRDGPVLFGFHTCKHCSRSWAGHFPPCIVQLVLLLIASISLLAVAINSAWAHRVIISHRRRASSNGDDRGRAGEPCTANIILSRHCNKRPPWDENPTPRELCTTHGLLRGENMARLFGPGGSFPVPTRLYARKMPEGTYSSRDLYLLWPVAQRLNIIVNTTFAGEEMQALADALLSERHALCSQTVLISWDHCSIPALAQALGCREGRCLSCWDDGDYDTMLWLQFKAGHPDDWHLAVNVTQQGYQAADKLEGYRECIGNPLDGQNFGYECSPPDLRFSN